MACDEKMYEECFQLFAKSDRSSVQRRLNNPKYFRWNCTAHTVAMSWTVQEETGIMFSWEYASLVTFVEMMDGRRSVHETRVELQRHEHNKSLLRGQWWKSKNQLSQFCKNLKMSTLFLIPSKTYSIAQ